MGLILDTSALVALERSGRSLAEVLAPLADEEVAIPAIVVAELLAGVRLADDRRRAARRRAKIDAVLGVVPVIDFSVGVAESWAELFAALERRGSRIPANDLAVAASAIYLGYSVLVGPHDEEHFRRVEGLDIVVLKPPAGEPSGSKGRKVSGPGGGSPA